MVHRPEDSRCAGRSQLDHANEPTRPRHRACPDPSNRLALISQNGGWRTELAPQVFAVLVKRRWSAGVIAVIRLIVIHDSRCFWERRLVIAAWSGIFPETMRRGSLYVGPGSAGALPSGEASSVAHTFLGSCESAENSGTPGCGQPDLDGVRCTDVCLYALANKLRGPFQVPRDIPLGGVRVS